MKEIVCFSDVVSEVIVRQSTIVIASNVEVLDETEMEEGNVSINFS